MSQTEVLPVGTDKKHKLTNKSCFANNTEIKNSAIIDSELLVLLATLETRSGDQVGQLSNRELAT